MTLTDEATALDRAERLTTLGASLRRALDGPYARERAAARSAFPAEGMLMDPSLDVDAARAWTLSRLKRLADAGFGAAGVPENSGAPADPLAAVVTFEALAHGDMSVTIKSGVQFGLFGGAVANLGTSWHHDTFLPDICSMKLLGGFAMTELGHGSDVASLETEIVYDHAAGEFDVHSPSPSATKAYIGNAAVDGTMAAVFGQLIVNGKRHGVHTILVPIRDDLGRDLPGVTTGDQGHKGGLLGVDNGTIRFEHVRVSRRMLLNRYGGVDEAGDYSSPISDPGRRFFTMLGTLVRGRVCIAAAGGVGARRALSIAVRHGLARRQFPASGRPGGVLLLDYVVHQRRLLPRVARAYALGFAQNDLTAALVHVQGSDAHTERDQRELETRAAGLKAVTTRFANEAVQEAREACGGAGYLSENRLTALRQDIDVFATFEGDNTVLMQLVTKALLTNYAEAWGALGRSGVVQEATRALGETVLERTAANLAFERLANSVRRRPEETALVDRGWHALMFSERARHSLESLARRMRAARSLPGDGFESFNRLGPHVQFVARAHMEQMILASFMSGIEACEDSETRDVLGRLCSLYALESIHSDRAWYLEHHRVSAGRSKALGEQIDALCRELRPHALPLVEGMGIPAQWLSAAVVDGSVVGTATYQPEGL